MPYSFLKPKPPKRPILSFRHNLGEPQTMDFNGFVAPVLCIPGFRFFSFLKFFVFVWDKKEGFCIRDAHEKRPYIQKALWFSGSIFSCHPIPMLSGGTYPYSHRFLSYIQKAVSRITGLLCCVISIFISALTACGSFHCKTGSQSLSGGSGLYTASSGLFHRPTRPSLLKRA